MGIDQLQHLKEILSLGDVEVAVVCTDQLKVLCQRRVTLSAEADYRVAILSRIYQPLLPCKADQCLR
jgi:hypothetical protein